MAAEPNLAVPRDPVVPIAPDMPRPVEGPTGKRTRYPVNEPPEDELPSGDPDYTPGRPVDPPQGN